MMRGNQAAEDNGEPAACKEPPVSYYKAQPVAIYTLHSNGSIGSRNPAGRGIPYIYNIIPEMTGIPFPL
jgi:hypothetical protein